MVAAMEVPKLLRWAFAVVLLLACARFGLPRALPLAERGDPDLLEQRATEKAQELGYGVSGRPLRLTYVDVKQITTILEEAEGRLEPGPVFKFVVSPEDQFIGNIRLRTHGEQNSFFST